MRAAPPDAAALAFVQHTKDGNTENYPEVFLRSCSIFRSVARQSPSALQIPASAESRHPVWLTPRSERSDSWNQAWNCGLRASMVIRGPCPTVPRFAKVPLGPVVSGMWRPDTPSIGRFPRAGRAPRLANLSSLLRTATVGRQRSAAPIAIAGAPLL